MRNHRNLPSEWMTYGRGGRGGWCWGGRNLTTVVQIVLLNDDLWEEGGDVDSSLTGKNVENTTDWRGTGRMDSLLGCKTPTRGGLTKGVVWEESERESVDQSTRLELHLMKNKLIVVSQIEVIRYTAMLPYLFSSVT